MKRALLLSLAFAVPVFLVTALVAYRPANQLESVSCTGGASATPEPEDLGIDFVSDVPLFARIAVNQDGSKVLTVAYDESGGTGTGYETVYLDRNFDGRFEPGEKIQAWAERWCDSVTGQFQPTTLEVPFNAAATNVDEPCVLDFASYKCPEKEYFSVIIKFRATQREVLWEYGVWPTLDVARRVSDCPVVDFTTPPTLTVDAKADPAKDGNSGFAFEIAVGDERITIMKAGVPAPARIVIRNARGEIVRDDTRTLREFAFG